MVTFLVCPVSPELSASLGYESKSCSVMSDSLWPHGLYSPWNSPGQHTGVGSRSLLQGIFPTQGSNCGLLHCRQILYQLSYQGGPSGDTPDSIDLLFTISVGHPMPNLFLNWKVASGAQWREGPGCDLVSDTSPGTYMQSRLKESALSCKPQSP